MSKIRRIAAAALLTAAMGCGGPGELGPQAYAHAQAVYALANRQAADRVEPLAATIASDTESGQVSDREARLLTDALEACRQGEWESAQQSARRMMEAQVQR